MKRKETKQLEEPLLDKEGGGEDDQIPISNIFKVSMEALKFLFNKDNDYKDRNKKLKDLGNTKKIMTNLATDPMTGIIGDHKDLQRRVNVYGSNKKPQSDPAKLLDSIIQTLNELIWLIVFISGAIAGVFGWIADGNFMGFMEGAAIIVTAVVIIVITSLADWYKDRQFVELQSLIKEEVVPVIRGKAGATQSISVWEIVVGDILVLNTGSGIPADCLVIDSVGLKVNNPQNAQDEGDFDQGKRKASNDDPFLFAGSIVFKGQAKAVVCAVGKNSSRGLVEEKIELNESSPIQLKLVNLRNRFTCFAIIASLLILAALIIFLFINMGTSDVWYDVLIKRLPLSANIIVVIFVVIVPEGLPLTVGVSLAFTVTRMNSQDKILVRNLNAPEMMGQINELLVGKTGTLTKGDMKVSKFWCEGQEVKCTRKNTLTNCGLSKKTLHKIYEGILFNAEARVEMDCEDFKNVGNNTEISMFKFLQDADIPIHLMIAKKFETYDHVYDGQGKIEKKPRVKAVSPFNSTKKRSAVAMVHPFRSDTVSIYVKGAPEVILEMSSTYESLNGEMTMDDPSRETILESITNMAKKPLRVLAFGYFEMDLAMWEQNFEGQNGRDFEDALDEQNIQLNFLACFGLKDSLRPRVSSAIAYAQKESGISIRMVSGDHPETAKAVALKAGVLTHDDLANLNYPVMTGEQFRATCGSVNTQINHESENNEQEIVFENREVFEDVVKDLKVLCRSTAEDKCNLVLGLKGLGQKVAVTGEGINDVEALHTASVGLAMGSGCTAARLASDLILTDNDFEAAIKAIMWGRNIYHNVTRFLQFQITVNISVLLVVFVGIFFFSESPLSAIQLLWINLIMDTGAALALATEPPIKTILKGQPTNTVLNATVWRQVLGISIWNFLVIFCLYVFGKGIASLRDFDNFVSVTSKKPDAKFQCGTPQQKTNCVTQKCIKDCNAYLDAQDKLKLFTIIFCTFVFLQVFNEINCRKIGVRDFNVFEDPLHNWWFIGVTVTICVVQYLQVNWFYWLTRTKHLDISQWGGCVIIGMTSLLVSLVLKTTPGYMLKFIPFQDFVDEDRAETNEYVEMALSKDPTNLMGKKDDGYNAVDDQDENWDNKAV